MDKKDKMNLQETIAFTLTIIFAIALTCFQIFVIVETLKSLL